MKNSIYDVIYRGSTYHVRHYCVWWFQKPDFFKDDISVHIDLRKLLFGQILLFLVDLLEWSIKTRFCDQRNRPIHMKGWHPESPVIRHVWQEGQRFYCRVYKPLLPFQLNSWSFKELMRILSSFCKHNRQIVLSISWIFVEKPLFLLKLPYFLKLFFFFFYRLDWVSYTIKVDEGFH